MRRNGLMFMPDARTKANLSVAMPLDYFCYKSESHGKQHVGRVDADNKVITAISAG